MLTPKETFAIIARRALMGHMKDVDGMARKRTEAVEPSAANRRRIDFRRWSKASK